MRLDDVTKTNILLRQIHASNQDEIDLGKLALDRAQNVEVKKFASQMVSDHMIADQKLTDLAKRSSIDLTGSPVDPVHQAMQAASEDYKRALRGLTGAQFDAAYVAPQTNMHSFVLHVVEEGQKVATGDTKKLLDETRPVVEGHLDHAKSLMKGLTFAPTAVGGGPGAEGAPMGSVQGGSGKGDAGRHEEPKKPGQKSNP